MSAENQKGVNVGIVVKEANLKIETETTMGAHVNSEKAYASIAEKKVTSK